MGSVSRRWRIATNAFRKNARSRRYWHDRPINTFTTNGYEVIPDFLDRAECQRLVALADDLLTPTSQRISGNCYTWIKAQAAHGRNTQVRELLNVNDVDDGVDRLMRNGSLQRLFADRLGEPVELNGFSIQVDGVDTTSKRDFHVDVLHPPVLKAFIYLTDVEQSGDGPYTIIPGSHRHWTRKAADDLVNAVTTAAARDMHRFADRRHAHAVLAPAGTLILSTQDAMHKGGSEQDRRPRYALIAQGAARRYFTDGPLTNGMPQLAPI